MGFKMRLLLLLHVLLILLACTNFTVLTFWLSDHGFTINYYHFGMQNGFGAPYESSFTFNQIITYLFAYLVGLVAFGGAMARLDGLPKVAGLIGVLASLIGLYSFGTEWLAISQPNKPYRTWVACSSVLMLALAAAASLPTRKEKGTPSGASLE